MSIIHRDFQNFLRTPEEFEFEGKYQIPKMKGMKLKNPQSAQDWDFIEYNAARKVEPVDRKDKFVHFFLDDYLFERVWTRITENVDFMNEFKGCLSPEFSQYTNMPSALRIYNHYRRMWLSAYWQYNGVRVIPVLCWSDKESFEYCTDGMPHNSLVAVSSVGCQRFSEQFEYGYKKSIDILEPSTILWFGKPFDWLTDTHNIIFKKGGYFSNLNRPTKSPKNGDKADEEMREDDD